MQTPRRIAPGRALGLRPQAEYSFCGSIWLRRRLWWRFTAAASLRLRSDVGFS